MGILRCYYFIAIVRGKSTPTFIIYAQNICLYEWYKKHMNIFAIEYMVNPALNVNKVFRYQVDNS